MNINHLVLVINPFFDAYVNSDLLGKGIFIALIAISIITWSLIIHKGMMIRNVKLKAEGFQQTFNQQKHNPLYVEGSEELKGFNPFREVYRALKGYTLDILGKNKRFGNSKAYLSSEDIDFVEAHTSMIINRETQKLESYLYILSTIVTLAPFLGLLGTVWGILSSFSNMQGAASSSQAVLSGLSLALATTVLGLIDAIPALIGYNYLKNSSRDFQNEMLAFANEVVAAVELQYRRVDQHFEEV